MKSTMKTIAGGVCAPRGFLAGALRAGIKRVASQKDDLALVWSDHPCTAAGVFTTNRVQAAPVLVSKQNLRTKAHRGILMNSGNANACTGSQGLHDARECVRLTAAAMGVKPGEILVCSTGRIGVAMPMGKIADGIALLPGRLSRKGSRDAAVAIMTSDTFPKQEAVEFSLGEKKVRVGGMAKGAGMINPNMATMLCAVTTDASLPAELAKKILARVAESTFNRITVDGDMSTNDTVLLLANGVSGVKIRASNKAEISAFEEALAIVCSKLARSIVQDGEGTTKIIEIDLQGARNPAQAKSAVDAVANSILLKCAWAGGDPNWGRLIDALGYSKAIFDPNKVDVFYEDLHLVKAGCLGPADMEKVRRVAALPAFRITIDLHSGKSARRILTSDLTEEYVRFNLSE